ncbi:Light-sensor Protein kinase [Cardamine amara subsp. amara]|uniref:Light-sensor Protein kinase n=1 Tax=Cardamine amara subsp. amara TaxID=228776 RepID=A0ABD1BU71_CARAN
MEQFREIGEVLGSMRALMVFKDNLQINQRQCTLLLDLFTAAYDSISESMRSNLCFKEKNTKWKILEQPLRELLWVVREGEAYVRMSLEPKLGFWAKAIVLHCNRDCTDFHIHNLLSCVPIIVEAIEIASEVSGWDEEEMSKKKLVHSNKYMKQWNDSQMFTWKFGREYLVTADFCNRLESSWTEDRWILIKELQKKTQPGSSKHDRKLADFLLKNLGYGNESPKLFPSSLLVSTKDYQVKRRLGNGSQYKEITWLGESFALRHFFGDIDGLLPQITPLLSLSHPNIVYYLCGFTDEEKKECFLVMELMSKPLGTHIKEVCGPRKKNTLSLPVAVDLMLQIALGMEYLHSKRIYHGELNPSNILVKPRRNNQSGDEYLHGKIFGFGLNYVKGFSCKSASSTGQTESFPFIWYSPEVLEEQEQSGTAGSLKYTDKSDVYSFGMVCFELLTGKVPFEDSHLQGDKMSRNIRAGERPLFPFHSPKFITNLTKRCWHADPNQRPTFLSISRILRYIKRFLALNPECHSSSSQQDPPIAPPVDYCDIETKLLQKLSWETTELTQVSLVPFQMFAYRVVERAKTCKKKNLRETSESGSEWASCSEDEGGAGSDEQMSSEKGRRRLSCSNEVEMSKKHVSKLLKRASGLKPIQKPGTPRGRSRHPPLSPCGQSMRANSESQLILISPKIRRSHSGHVSDSELS